MSYTLGEAAKRTGKSKPTIHRAIKSGKISATRNDDGSYTIEAAELHRVFPPLPGNGDASPEMRQSVTLNETGGLQARLEAAEREKGLLRELLDREREISRGLQEDRDHWRKQATALLEKPRTEEPKPGWWSRLVGRS